MAKNHASMGHLQECQMRVKGKLLIKKKIMIWNEEQSVCNCALKRPEEGPNEDKMVREKERERERCMSDLKQAVSVITFFVLWLC